MKFESFCLHPSLTKGVEKLGYVEPTPIQRQAIPIVLSGRDMIGLAQTGTGKTAAFALPILSRLQTGPRGCVRALVLAPTRELAEQIHEHVDYLGRRVGIKGTTVYGGVSMNAQVAKLRRGPEIVVACPGRLLDHLGRASIDLESVEILVLDEADRMFDMGFLPDVKKIMRYLPKTRQTLLFSATMPDEIDRLARDILQNPAIVRIDHDRPLDTISHTLYPVPRHLKTQMLLKLVADHGGGSVLVFTKTRHRASNLAKKLGRVGVSATSLQGDLSQNQRKAAISGFRDGRFRIMVATDIAARGIDVSRVTRVINYEIPDTSDAYTHRIGRTGRAGKTGEAITLVAPEDESAVRDIERTIKISIPRKRLSGFDYESAPEPGTVHGRKAQPERDPSDKRNDRKPFRKSGRAHFSPGGKKRRQKTAR